MANPVKPEFKDIKKGDRFVMEFVAANDSVDSRMYPSTEYAVEINNNQSLKADTSFIGSYQGILKEILPREIQVGDTVLAAYTGPEKYSVLYIDGEDVFLRCLKYKNSYCTTSLKKDLTRVSS